MTNYCFNNFAIIGKMSKQQRYKNTVKFISDTISKKDKIIDLGIENKLSDLLKRHGFHVKNTNFDLDEEPDKIKNYEGDIVTGFEVLEHLIEPAQLLKRITQNKVIFSVPLLRMLEKVYWNDADEYDQHFHEFTEKQFNKLLNYCGFRIIKSKKWKSYSSFIGKLIYKQPKYYIVYAEKIR